MTISDIIEMNENLETQDNDLVRIESSNGLEIYIYPRSINKLNESTFFIGKINDQKFLFILTQDKKSSQINDFDGELILNSNENIILKKCNLIHSNALKLQELFPFTKPILLGLSNSFGFGDRLGIANSAHIRSLEGSDFKPVIAQQSIRELTRTNRSADEVMDAAVWAVFQEGYKNGFGADADHLKTVEDIDRMIKAGFTMFTFDPSDYVINEADTLGLLDVENKVNELNWSGLEDSLTELVNRYTSVSFNVSDDFLIVPNYEDVLRAALKYGNAVAHIKLLYQHLESNYQDSAYEIEISVDETESVTSPFEHFFIVSELTRLGVKIISLAPRFIGEFEKGIDYKGDLELFKEEYLKHVIISEYFGSYKISLHSGSDKFDIYKAIGQLKRGYTHVKTAGTSYLEALKVIAKVNPNEFRKILDFARSEFEKEKLTYHVSADINNVFPSDKYSDDQLVELFTQNDARQVLHVTFGKVLTSTDEKGNLLFKEEIFNCLQKNEDLHYHFLIEHFKNHLEPFN